MTNVIEMAVRNKIRFNSPIGIISVEDAFDLPLKTLDTMYRSLIKDSGGEEGLLKPTPEDKELTLRMDVLKHVFEVREKENKARLHSELTRQKKDRIRELIQKKKDEDLAGKSEEELEALLSELE